MPTLGSRSDSRRPDPDVLAAAVPRHGADSGTFCAMVAERSAVLMSPMSFLVRPARWIHMLATNGPCLSAAPNFAFELSVRRTSDDDMAGLDLGNVQRIVSGSERIHVATVKRFTERFAPHNLSPRQSVRLTGSRKQRFMWRVPNPAPRSRRSVSTMST